ncbi:MAG: tRNA dihydrouridine synthase DusB [Lachnospiraceae bacterium]|nr:tRNA dihydrouridine synthase DusB [Lachnospiraceae bacterium]MDE7240168.1 tRNA dihydrouridine synthase DusB [Lachnospiraceae bacterium]
MQLKIGNVTLPNNIILAPMAGVTDLPFRVLCAEQGAGMVCMEMISAKALSYHNKNTEELLHISEKEGLVSLQLFGSEPELMGEMAKQIEERPFAVLDINMGCPVPKIVNNGEGSALMKNPLLAGKIIEAVARSTDKPVTVKIRRGFDDAHENAAEIARIAQESGAAAVTVHGRTREQYYAGEADLTCIRAVKQALRIPVIGNGDVADAASAKRMLEETGCDGVMVGRAARGNPWIFTQIARGLAEERVEKPDRDEVKHMMLRHAGMLLEEKGEYIGVREMRKHVAWYTAGYPNSAAMRRAVNEVTSYAALEKLLDTIW